MAFDQLNRKNTRDPLPSVAVKVQAYIEEKGRHMVQGIRLDTKEPVKVYLRDDNNPKRPALTDFANSNHPQLSTKVGGSILFDSCYRDADGNLSAKWATCANRTGEPKNGVVLANVMARLAVSKGGTPYVTIANQTGAKVVHGQEEFAAAVGEALKKPETSGWAPGNPGFILRGIDADGDVFTVVRNRDANLSAEEQVAKIVGEMDPAVWSYMGQQGVWEVIPTANIGTGKFARENDRRMDPADYAVGQAAGGRTVYGFAPSNVVVGPLFKEGKVDGYFAKSVGTVYFKPDCVPPGYVPTASVAPKFDKERYFSEAAERSADTEHDRAPAAEHEAGHDAGVNGTAPAPEPEPEPEPEFGA